MTTTAIAALDDGPNTVEASELHLAPGHWPRRLVYTGQVWDRTSALRDPDGDVVYVRYATLNGLSMLVWND